jgi:hypothetical protein
VHVSVTDAARLAVYENGMEWLRSSIPHGRGLLRNPRFEADDEGTSLREAALALGVSAEEFDRRRRAWTAR